MSFSSVNVLFPLQNQMRTKKSFFFLFFFFVNGRMKKSYNVKLIILLQNVKTLIVVALVRVMVFRLS